MPLAPKGIQCQKCVVEHDPVAHDFFGVLLNRFRYLLDTTLQCHIEDAIIHLASGRLQNAVFSLQPVADKANRTNAGKVTKAEERIMRKYNAVVRKKLPVSKKHKKRLRIFAPGRLLKGDIRGAYRDLQKLQFLRNGRPS